MRIKKQKRILMLLLRDTFKKATSLLAPRAAFIIKKIDELDKQAGTIQLEGITLQLGKIITSQLKNTESVAMFQCTIGSRVESYSEELFKKGDSLEGYIVNLSGSEAAEATAEFAHQEIRKMAEENEMKITNRFSPGYCNWDVIEQFKLFGFFPKGYCGISLTDSALMNPVKSVSGLIGLGQEVKFRAYNCSKCDDEHCIYRRETSK